MTSNSCEKKIMIVGCGPGGKDYLTLAALNAVRAAQTVFGAARLFELFEQTDLPAAKRVPLETFHKDDLGQIAAAAEKNIVAILVTGDPGCYSFARMLLNHFGASRCRVIAGVSSVQAAFSAIGLPWQEARIVSVHGRNPSVSHDALTDETAVAILGGGKESAMWLYDCAKKLLTTHAVWLCHDVTLQSETILPIDESVLQSNHPNSAGESSAFAQNRTILLLWKKDSGSDSAT